MIAGRLLAHGASIAFHWPSIVTISWIGWYWKDLAEQGANLVMEAFVFDLSLRFARLAAIILHEFAHVLAAFVVSFFNGSAFPVFSLHLTLRQFIVQLFPGTIAPGLHVEIQPCGSKLSSSKKETVAAEASNDSIVRTAGLVFSAVLPVVLACGFDMSYALVGETTYSWLCGHACRALWYGGLLALDGAVLSDLPGGPLIGPLPPIGFFCCGNWGLMVPRDRLGDDCKTTSYELFPRVCEHLLSRVLDIVEMRGAQAGGFITFLSAGADRIMTFRSRTVKTKRGHLGKMMFGKFQSSLTSTSRWSTLFCCCRRRPRTLPVILAQGHSRFGTSSAPAVVETHPHQWLGPHMETVWTCDEKTGKWTKKTTEVCVTITHNGDFDGWNVFDEHVPNGTLGEWLSRLFYYNNDAKGDSPKAAGLMDFLITKGMWAPAVRFAFVRVVQKHVDQASGWNVLQPGAQNVMPKPAIYQAWAKAFESAFQATVAAGKVDRKSLADQVLAIFENQNQLVSNFGGSQEAVDALEQWQLEGVMLQDFCKKACNAFFQHDLLSSLNQFFERAEGTFGITASCSLWTNKVVLAAKGQPISLAFDPERPMVFWASEPSSLAAKWPSDAKKQSNAGTCRFDMHDATGEAIELMMMTGSTAQAHLNALNPTLKDHSTLSKCNYFPLQTYAGRSAELPYHILLRGCSLNRFSSSLKEESFNKRLVNFAVSPAVRVKDQARLDPIEKDLNDVPDLIEEIDSTWSDRTSLNRVSALKIARCLHYLLTNREEKKDGEIDVLIYGIENSLWLGQQFGADLARIFPNLKIVCLSSNWIVGMLQKAEGRVDAVNWTLNPDNIKVARHGVCLAVSQSGTTYPTVWASRLLCRFTELSHMFALSGDFDTVLANSIGQSNDSVAFSGNLFSTLSGLRPCEPSTVATLGMHHTLTHLLLYVARYIQECNATAAKKAEEAVDDVATETKVAVCTIKMADISDMDHLARTFGRSAEELVGVTDTGIKLQSPAFKDLLKLGDAIGSHLVEPYWSFIFSAAYVFITVTVGHLVVTTIWTTIVGEAKLLDEDTVGYTVSLWITRFIDATIYVFLGFIMPTFHRKCTGKRLFIRYTARAVVILDCTVNYKLLRAYISKLRALCFRMQAFSVFGQNPTDHFVHEYTHLAHSDVILAVGRQDGRVGSLAAAESAVIMASQQARYTSKSKYGGIEAVSLGHNPWLKEGLFANACILPTRHRPRFLSQEMLQTEEGGHAPSSVMPKVACILNEGRGHDSRSLLSVEFKEVLKRMNGKTSLPASEADEVVKSIIASQAEDIGIGKEDHEKMPEAMLFETAERKAAMKGEPGSPGNPPIKKKGSGGVAAANIMAMLRSTKIQTWLQGKKMEQVKMAIWKEIFGGDQAGARTALMEKTFSAWKIVVDLNPARKSKTKKGDADEEVAGEWRKTEEIRRNLARRQATIGINLDVTFGVWKTLTRNNSATAGKLRPVGTGFKVGAGLAKAGSGSAILKGLRNVETLYETRIAAAERLLGFYVVFHRAVKHLSKLPFAGFDLDRSESRLRVASTPAPIPFVEQLAPMNMKSLDAILKLQRQFKRAQKRRLGIDHGKPDPEISRFASGCEESTPRPDSMRLAAGLKDDVPSGTGDDVTPRGFDDSNRPLQDKAGNGWKVNKGMAVSDTITLPGQLAPIESPEPPEPHEEAATMEVVET